MILYNITVSIDAKVAEEWLEWMRTKHILDVLNTGCFIEARISRVHGEEDGGLTYAVSYVALSEEKYEHYKNAHAAGLQQEHMVKFGGTFAAFRTVLSIIEEFKR
jgi:hypothetical protein